MTSYMYMAWSHKIDGGPEICVYWAIVNIYEKVTCKDFAK